MFGLTNALYNVSDMKSPLTFSMVTCTPSAFTFGRTVTSAQQGDDDVWLEPQGPPHPRVGAGILRLGKPSRAKETSPSVRFWAKGVTWRGSLSPAGTNGSWTANEGTPSLLSRNRGFTTSTDVPTYVSTPLSRKRPRDSFSDRATIANTSPEVSSLRKQINNFLIYGSTAIILSNTCPF